MNSAAFKHLYTEERRRADQTVEGLDRFIEWIELVKEDALPPGLTADIKKFIERSGCPKIKFENIAAAGISKGDECIVASGILNGSLAYLLYVIFHEVAHQFQYSKHGEEFARDVYFGEEGIDRAADLLLKIENTADRYALRVLRYMDEKYSIPGAADIHPVYKNARVGVTHHIQRVRNMLVRANITNVVDANELIYNTIKIVNNNNKHP